MEPTVAPPSDDIAEFLSKLSIKAMGATVVFDGPMPTRPIHYYSLASRGGRYSFVYLLRDSMGYCLYVGKSRNPGSRFDRHRRRDWWQWVSDVTLLEVCGDSAREADAMALFVEQRAIWHFGPAYNVAGVRP